MSTKQQPAPNLRTFIDAVIVPALLQRFLREQSASKAA